MGVLVDSNVLISLERRGLSPSVLKVDKAEDTAISAITYSELLFGLERAKTGEQRSRRQAFIAITLDELPVLPFGMAESRIYARLWSELLLSGQRIGIHDFIIAATALTHEYELLTDNVREFSRVPGLTVRQPTW
jgi:predicted nucleic acid-binding protein